jgi:hypothetical protein
MKKLSIMLIVVSCLLFITTSFAAQPTKKNSNPDLVGTWAIVNYADGRIYDYPYSCAVITSQNGNLFEGTFYWWNSTKMIDPGTTCYDSWDPVSCPVHTVKEYFATSYGYRQAAFSGSINSNQVIMHGEGSINYTDANGNTYVYQLNRTPMGLYDQAADTVNGVTHISVVTDVNNSLYSVSNETRGFKMYNRGTPCPMTATPASPMTWVGH